MSLRFTRPTPFREAVASSQMRTLLPTSMTTAELDQLDADFRAQARFSAQVRLAEHIDVIDQGVDGLVNGTTDLPQARLALKRFLARIGYEPDPKEKGGLKDLSSDVRIDLQLSTGEKQAHGAGWYQQGQDETLLDAFPASAFVRVEHRQKPRQNWPQRWNDARAATTADGATDSSTGEMVALKNHPIWRALSRFGQPYEPFDFGSGMGQEDRNRKTAMALGLLGQHTRIPPDRLDLNAHLQVSPEVRSARLRQLIEASGVGRFDEAGVLHFVGGGAAQGGAS